MLMGLGDFPSWKNMTANKQLFHQNANQSDAFNAEKVHHRCIDVRSENISTNYSVYLVTDL